MNKDTKKRILLVDDDEGILKAIKLHLDLDHDVDTACDGDEGLELVRKNQYDVIITDLSMPSMNGDEMISKIREFNSKVAILMYTGDIDAEERMTGFKDIPMCKKSDGVMELKTKVDEVLSPGKR